MFSALLPQLQASISPAIKLEVVSDRTTTVRAALRDIEITLLISVALVILVVFVFLRTVRATIIPSIAVPLSLIGTFGVMYLLGYTLDNLSLMALAISTGFVVDDAIVVLENITRYLEQGVAPVQAAFRGAREIGFTVLSMSTSLVAVFIPILLMGGIVGRLFREFAVTLSIAIAVSLAVSLTTTPTMCAQLLKPIHEEKHGRAYKISEKMFDGILRFYRIALGWVLRHQFAVLVITIATACLSVYLFQERSQGFLSAAGYRAHSGCGASGAGHLFRRDEPQDAPLRRYRDARSEYLHNDWLLRRHHGDEPGTHVHHAKAAG